MTHRLAGGLLAVVLVAAVGLAPAGAQGDEPQGSLVQQILVAAEASLGDEGAVAVVHAYDRGYDLLQIVEAMFEGLVAADGTITDDEGAPLAPFRAPSGLIEGDGSSATTGGFAGEGPSGEAFALALLERGITTTTKTLDKKVDIEQRAERADVSEVSLFTMLAVMFLAGDGYSPEQIIVDGLLADGIRFASPVSGLVIVDEKGKKIRPAGVEQSPEREEAGDQIDGFLTDIVDTIGGIDPYTAARTSFTEEFVIEIEIAFSGDSSLTLVGKGHLGPPKKRSVRGYVVGNGGGEVVGAGACSLSEGDTGPHPYEVSGTVEFGFSGPVDNERASIRIAQTNVDIRVAGDDSLCVDVVRDTAGFLESLTFGPVEVRLRGGATGSSETTIGEDPVTTTVKLS